MSERDSIAALGDWQDFTAGTIGRFAAGEMSPREEVWIELFPKRKTMVCSGCMKSVTRIHDSSERWIRDLPVWGADTYLLLHRRRVKCKRCGIGLEYIEWLEPYARVTKRLAESVARMCDVLPVKQVAEYFGLSWGSTKRIHKSRLKSEFDPIDLSGVTQIILDEFAIQKGHRYATVVVDPERRKVLWVGRGRGREDVRPFFELLGEEGCEALKAVGMDMHAPYEEEVRAHCPDTEIVYDLFHVVSKCGREVIDRVRVDESNRLRTDKKARKVIKGSRWLLLRNRENIKKEDDRIRLKELLGANKKLLTVYVLKDDLKHLWSYRARWAAERFWQQWYDRAIRSRIEPLKKFARNLKARISGVLSHCEWPLHTSLIEGINNKIKVIKRMAYGFRDDEYFFLRIRSAFPGNR